MRAPMITSSQAVQISRCCTLARTARPACATHGANSEDAIFQLGPYTFRRRRVKDAESPRATKKCVLTEKTQTKYTEVSCIARRGLVAAMCCCTKSGASEAPVSHRTNALPENRNIYRLRQKIEPDPSNVRLLVNLNQVATVWVIGLIRNFFNATAFTSYRQAFSWSFPVGCTRTNEDGRERLPFLCHFCLPVGLGRPLLPVLFLP